MSIIRVGTNKNYAAGWDRAFGKKKPKSSGQVTAKKKTVKKKSRKKA